MQLAAGPLALVVVVGLVVVGACDMISRDPLTFLATIPCGIIYSRDSKK